MYVCICHKVTDKQIEKAADDGLCTMQDLSAQLKVASCCGKCGDCARKVLHRALTDKWNGSDLFVQPALQAG